MKKVELIICVSAEEAPSNYYVVDAMGRYVFAKTKDRQKAKEAFDNEYGKNKYSVRTTDLAAKAGKPITAR